MKKLILFAAILFAGVSVANAQGQISKPNYQGKNSQTVTEGVHNEANTNLTVKLNSIQSISVNTSNVTLEYTTVEDYKKGVSSGNIVSHIEVNSTGAYNVNVHYDDASNSGAEGSTEGSLESEAMFNTITVAVTANKSIGEAKSSLLVGEATGANIITSTKGEFGALFDVDYQGMGAEKYINSIKGGSASARTYIANVFYTITAS